MIPTGNKNTIHFKQWLLLNCLPYDLEILSVNGGEKISRYNTQLTVVNFTGKRKKIQSGNFIATPRVRGVGCSNPRCFCTFVFLNRTVLVYNVLPYVSNHYIYTNFVYTVYSNARCEIRELGGMGVVKLVMVVRQCVDIRNITLSNFLMTWLALAVALSQQFMSPYYLFTVVTLSCPRSDTFHKGWAEANST